MSACKMHHADDNGCLPSKTQQSNCLLFLTITLPFCLWSHSVSLISFHFSSMKDGEVRFLSMETIL